MLPSGGSTRDIGLLPRIGSNTDRWAVAEGDYGGSPLIVRSNITARQWCGHSSLGVKLGFAVPLSEPNHGGLPSPTENERLNAVEDAIISEVAAGSTGVYALILTTGTMREFVFYLAPGATLPGCTRTFGGASRPTRCSAKPLWIGRGMPTRSLRSSKGMPPLTRLPLSVR